MPPDAVSFVAGTQEQGRTQRFVAVLLRQEGALVEAIEPEGLEVLAPPALQRVLEIRELSRLGFGATLPPQAQRVGIEGDWLERFATLLGPQGRFAHRVLSPAAKAPGDPDRVLERELVLDNATFRLLGVAPCGRAICCSISVPRPYRTTNATSSSILVSISRPGRCCPMRCWQRLGSPSRTLRSTLARRV